MAWRAGCDLRLEERSDGDGDQLRVLGQGCVARGWEAPKLGVRKALSEQMAVLRVHHRVVVAVGNERRLRDAGKPVELRLVRNTPGGNRGELCVAGRQVSRFVTVDFALVEAPYRLHALGATLLG